MSKKKSSPINFAAVDRQKETYIGGMSGQRPKIPFDLKQLATLAQEKISPEAYAYIAGGAGTEDTITQNRSDFAEWRILPRMLRDVSERDTGVEIFGQRFDSPFFLAPIGVLDLAHKKGDLAVASAAAKAKIPMIFSNQASLPMEACAAQMGDSPRWFQLYWSKSNELVRSLVERAEACGCGAIVVTLDTTMLGWRIQDLDLAYLPFLRGRGIAQYISDPIFQKLIDQPDEEPAPKTSSKLTLDTIANIRELMTNYPGGLVQNLRSKRPLKAVRKFISIYSRPSLTWNDLAFLREVTQLPILLKGILHPEDARLALEHGMNGIIVSNHGGRQVDGAISSIAALPGVMEVIGDKIPVLLDSGIRSGADTFKALALGASGVCIGRPYVYGLAVGGEKGVLEVLKNFRADFELTMALAGCRTVEEIQRHCLVRKP